MKNVYNFKPLIYAFVHWKTDWKAKQKKKFKKTCLSPPCVSFTDDYYVFILILK